MTLRQTEWVTDRTIPREACASKNGWWIFIRYLNYTNLLNSSIYLTERKIQWSKIPPTTRCQYFPIKECQKYQFLTHLKNQYSYILVIHYALRIRNKVIFLQNSLPLSKYGKMYCKIDFCCSNRVESIKWPYLWK